MSQFVQLKSAYRISELDLDRIATKTHQRKNKLIVKIYYKPNRKTHTDLLFQTPELLLKNNVKYNKKGYYELEAPFLGKKQKNIKLYEDFITSLEDKIIQIIKKNKDWFSDKNIQFKSIIRFPNKKEDMYKLLRLKIDSDTVVKHNKKNIDINSLMKDYYVKCILKVSFIYIKGSFVTINIYPVVIDLRDKIEDLQFASSESSISSELTTDSEIESEDKAQLQVDKKLEEEEKEEKEVIVEESLDEHITSMLEVPSNLRDNCGTSEMFKESNNKDEEILLNSKPEINQSNSPDKPEVILDEEQLIHSNSPEKPEVALDKLEVTSSQSDITSEPEDNDDKEIINDSNLEIEQNLNNDTDTSIMSNFNSDKILETYGGPQIKNIDLSEESKDSDYSEEIDSDEIAGWEQKLI
jgi:hypothetical protein